MSRETQYAFVAVVVLAASGITMPSTMALIQASAKTREGTAVLQGPTHARFLSSEILIPILYDPTSVGVPPEEGWAIVVAIAQRSEGEATLAVWGSLTANTRVQRAGVRLILAEVAADSSPPVVPGDVAVVRVTDPEAFSMRTGIRAVPFTVMMTHDGHVSAAGLGIPDTEFVLAAVDGFLAGGRPGPTTFRPVTPAINASLRPIGVPANLGTPLR